MVAQAQSLVLLVLGIGALVLQIYCLVDAARRRPDAFPATGNQTKVFWMVLLGVCAAIAFVSIFSPLGIFSLIGLVAAGVYLFKVRPGIIQITGGGRPGASGPYGGW